MGRERQSANAGVVAYFEGLAEIGLHCVGRPIDTMMPADYRGPVVDIFPIGL